MLDNSGLPEPQLVWCDGTMPGHDVYSKLVSLADFASAPRPARRRDPSPTHTTSFAVVHDTGARLCLRSPPGRLLHTRHAPHVVQPLAFASISTSPATLPPLLAPTLEPPDLSCDAHSQPHTPPPPVRKIAPAPETQELSALNNAKRLLSGAVSAIVSRTCVAPLERVKLELVLRNTDKTHVLDVARDVLAAEGVRGFWKAHLINILRTTPYKAINYASYDFYKQQLARITAAHSVDEKVGRFVAGALAGLTAMATCFPLDVIRTRVLAASHHATASHHHHHHARPRLHHHHHGHTSRQSIVAMTHSIIKSEGIGALYAGCLPALISIVPSGAVFYGLFDLLKDSYLQARHKARVEAAVRAQGGKGRVADVEFDDCLGAGLTLLFGAAAGAAAETAVYPLEVIRRRMQLQSLARATATSAGGVASVGGFGTVGAAAARGGQAVMHSSAWKRFIGTTTLIMHTEGLRGFYVGLLPNVLQVLPNAALSYYTYDLLKRLLNAQ